jgi:S1-C subfamily serine protease
MKRADLMQKLILSCLMCLATGVVANADERRDNLRMIRLLHPISDGVGDSVVQVLSSGRVVALGTVVSPDGYVLTKRSELSGDPVRVRLRDDRILPARVAAVRRHSDLALLRIESDVTLPAIEFSDETPAIASFLISPGRSGRPIGFGVVGVKTRAIEHRGRLGVVLKNDSRGRAMVEGVYPDSGAEVAGIIPGDLIVAIDGRKEFSRKGVIDTLRGMFPGETVKLTILRSNSSRELDKLEMDARIREFAVMQESESDSKVNGPRNMRLSGFELVIQHDTVLDPDECGGPLLDTSGSVVGINIARAGRVVSYALPTSVLKPELASMLKEARASSK